MAKNKSSSEKIKVCVWVREENTTKLPAKSFSLQRILRFSLYIFFRSCFSYYSISLFFRWILVLTEFRFALFRFWLLLSFLLILLLRPFCVLCTRERVCELSSSGSFYSSQKESPTSNVLFIHFYHLSSYYKLERTLGVKMFRFCDRDQYSYEMPCVLCLCGWVWTREQR